MTASSTTTTTTTTTTTAAPAGACDRMQRCCDTPAGRSQHLTQICATVPLVRTTPSAETTCQHLFDSAGRLLTATGGTAPPECQP